MKQNMKDDTVSMSAGEAEKICRLGTGAPCCAYLAVGAEGFICIHMDTSLNKQIEKRLRAGTMSAKGTGGWKGCYWEGDVEDGG